MFQLPLPPPIGFWKTDIPLSHHSRFLNGEAAFCNQEATLFFQATTPEDTERYRQQLLDKRNQYLTWYVNNEMG